jgi:hypothetical protein
MWGTFQTKVSPSSDEGGATFPINKTDPSQGQLQITKQNTVFVEGGGG